MVAVVIVAVVVAVVAVVVLDEKSSLGTTVILQLLFPTGFGQHNKIEVIRCKTPV